MRVPKFIADITNSYIYYILNYWESRAYVSW